MSEGNLPVERREPSGFVLAIYVLLLAAFISGVTWLIAGVMAYLGRGDAPAWQQGHYRFQIRTFWIGLLLFVLSLVTLPVLGLGFLLGALATLWVVIRCVKGILWLQKGVPVPDPESWAFGDRRG